MPSAIETHDLARRFGEIPVMGGVSLEVRRGEVVGFLGPDAAGKSNTVKIAGPLRAVLAVGGAAVSVHRLRRRL